MKNNIHDTIYALIYVTIGVLGYIGIFFVIIPLGCDIIYPTFGFIITIGFITIASWLFMTGFSMFALLVADMFFKK